MNDIATSTAVVASESYQEMQNVVSQLQQQAESMYQTMLSDAEQAYQQSLDIAERSQQLASDIKAYSYTAFSVADDAIQKAQNTYNQIQDQVQGPVLTAANDVANSLETVGQMVKAIITDPSSIFSVNSASFHANWTQWTTGVYFDFGLDLSVFTQRIVIPSTTVNFPIDKMPSFADVAKKYLADVEALLPCSA